MLTVTNLSFKLNKYNTRNQKTQYISKPIQLKNDSFELSFKGIASPKVSPEDCQKLLTNILDILPEHIKTRIIPKFEKVNIAETLSKAIDSDISEEGKTLYEELPASVIELGDIIRNSLPKEYLKVIDAIASDKKSFDALPKGKSPLFIESQKGVESEVTKESELLVTLYTQAGGKEVAIPQEITDVLLIIKDLDLNNNQKEAFLRSLTGVADESSTKGFAKADFAKEVKQIDESESEGKFVAVGLGEEKYSIYISTNNGDADIKNIQQGLEKSIAQIIIKDFGLDYNRETASAYERDIRVHNIHRAISNKVFGTEENGFKSLRLMLKRLAEATALSSKTMMNIDPDSEIGIIQALEDVITDLFMNTNRHDPNDRDLISQMYATLSKTVREIFGLAPKNKLIEG